MDMMEVWHGAAVGQPHQVTVSGSLVHFVTDMAAPLIITGTGNITICGKNLFDYQNATIVDKRLRNDAGEVKYDGQASYSSSITVVPPSMNMVCSGYSTENTNGKRMYFLDSNGGWISRTDGKNTPASTSFKGTTPENCYYVQLQLVNVARETWDTVQIEFGTTASSFESYTGSTAAAGTPRKSLVGINNVWSDSGNVTVTYWTH